MDTTKSLAFKFWCEQSTEGVLAFDREGRVLILNKWLWNLFALQRNPQTVEALIDQTAALVPDLEKLLIPAPTHAHMQWGSLAIKNYQPQQITWQRVPLVEANNVTGTLMIFRDATTQGHTELSKQSFLSMISHDLRTPLSTILGYAELLYNSRGNFSDEEQTEFLGHIIKNANQLSRYAQIALDVMYLEADLQTFETEVVSLGRFINHWLGDATHRLTADRIVLQDGFRQEPYARVAPSAMHRILYILVEFALAESPPDVPVHIQLGFDDDRAHVLIKHRAQGLHGDDIPNLFRLMHPRDFSEEGRPQLHRMQLYVANLLAQRQNAQLTINQEGDNAYAFDLTLPLMARDARFTE